MWCTVLCVCASALHICLKSWEQWAFVDGHIWRRAIFRNEATANHRQPCLSNTYGTYCWPIRRPSSLQNPSHWWPGMYTDPGPPLWFCQYGGSHRLLIWQFLKTVESNFLGPNYIWPILDFFVLSLSFLFLYPIPAAEHVRLCTMWSLEVGSLEMDSWGSLKCSHLLYSLSNY